MLEAHRSELQADASEFVRAWVLVDGTRCVVVVIDRLLELRLIDGDTIFRRARFTDIARALNTAQLWRIEWEIGWSRHNAEAHPLCLDSDAEARTAAPINDGPLRFRCPSCGYVWRATGALDELGN